MDLKSGLPPNTLSNEAMTYITVPFIHDDGVFTAAARTV